jgi:hypothetical protein
MDRVYEGGQTRQLALDLGYIPAVPTEANRLSPWQYSRAMYKKRNEIERLFRGSRDFVASSPGSISLMPSSSPSSASPSSSKHSDCVNRP